jgi:hypothetical protein
MAEAWFAHLQLKRLFRERGRRIRDGRELCAAERMSRRGYESECERAKQRADAAQANGSMLFWGAGGLMWVERPAVFQKNDVGQPMTNAVPSPRHSPALAEALAWRGGGRGVAWGSRHHYAGSAARVAWRRRNRAATAIETRPIVRSVSDEGAGAAVVPSTLSILQTTPS